MTCASRRRAQSAARLNRPTEHTAAAGLPCAALRSAHIRFTKSDHSVDVSIRSSRRAHTSAAPTAPRASLRPTYAPLSVPLTRLSPSHLRASLRHTRACRGYLDVNSAIAALHTTPLLSHSLFPPFPLTSPVIPNCALPSFLRRQESRRTAAVRSRHGRSTALKRRLGRLSERR